MIQSGELEIQKKIKKEQVPSPKPGGFTAFTRRDDTVDEHVSIPLVQFQFLCQLCMYDTKQTFTQEQRSSATRRHKEKNYNKNFIKSIGAKIIEFIKENLNQYLQVKGIIDYQIENHVKFLDEEKKMSVQYFKSLMSTEDDDTEQNQMIKKINRSLGFVYLKRHSQRDIYRKNKIINENQGAYLLHCKILERKLSNPRELDYLC